VKASVVENMMQHPLSLKSFYLYKVEVCELITFAIGGKFGRLYR